MPTYDVSMTGDVTTEWSQGTGPPDWTEVSDGTPDAPVDGTFIKEANFINKINRFTTDAASVLPALCKTVTNIRFRYFMLGKLETEYDVLMILYDGPGAVLLAFRDGDFFTNNVKMLRGWDKAVSLDRLVCDDFELNVKTIASGAGDIPDES